MGLGIGNYVRPLSLGILTLIGIFGVFSPSSHSFKEDDSACPKLQSVYHPLESID